MPPLSKIFIISIAVLMSGCASVLRFTDENEERQVYRGIYPATKIDIALLTAAANDTGSSWMSGIPVLLSPFAIIDIPFSLITDTVLLPFDGYNAFHNAKYIDFWEQVRDEKKLSLPMDEYLEYYDETGVIVIIRQSRNASDEELLKLYFDVSIADDSEIHKSNKVIHNVIKQTNNIEELSALRDHVCKVSASNIDNKKLDNVFGKMMSYGKYNSECADILAKAGLPYKTLVTNRNLSDKNLHRCFNKDKTAYIEHLASNPSTPSDIQTEIVDSIYSKLIKQNGSIKNLPSVDERHLKMIARLTKDETLIARMYAFDNEAISNALKNGVKAQSDLKALMDIELNDKTTREKRLWLIKSHASNKQLMLAIASGKHVDMEIYKALMEIPDKSIRSTCISKLVHNKELLDENILYNLVERSDTKDTAEPYIYKKLLALTEIATINITDFGIIGFKKSKNNYDPDAIKKLPDYQEPGQYFIEKQTTTVPNIAGTKFGIIYNVDLQLSAYGADLTHKITYRTDSSDNSSSKEVTVEMEKDWSDKGENYVYYQELSGPWELTPGMWKIQLSHKDRILVTKSFHVVDNEI